MILGLLKVGAFQTNCYILAEGQGMPAVVIDPGDEAGKIKARLKKYNLKPAAVINTHGHIDHIGCDDEFGVPVYIHRCDRDCLNNPQLNLSAFFFQEKKVNASAICVEDKDVISIGGFEFEVIHTPGHTPGGMCLLLKKPEGGILFSGDTLFSCGIGRTDFPGASEVVLVDSIKKKLLLLPEQTLVYPGHGPETTIGQEKVNNPFF